MGMQSSKEEPLVWKKREGSETPIVTGDMCDVLLLGTGFSGKSTLFYQLSRIEEKNSMTDKLAAGHIPHIYYNAYQITCGVGNLCAQDKSFEKPESEKLFRKIEKLGADSKEANSFMETLKQSPITKSVKKYDIFDTWIELWNDHGMIENLLKQKNSTYYFDGAEHFCRTDVLERMKLTDYLPTDADVLRSRKKTTGISRIQLESKNMSYEFIDVGGQQNERRKWKAVFKEADVLLYIVSLSDFDEFLWEDATVNRMKEALQTFEQTINNEYFGEIPIIIVFNKEDLLVKKILEKDTLVEHFPDYSGGTEPVHALNFIQKQFLDLYKGNPDNMNHIHVALLDNEHVREGFELLEKVSLKLKKDGKIKDKTIRKVEK